MDLVCDTEVGIVGHFVGVLAVDGGEFRLDLFRGRIISCLRELEVRAEIALFSSKCTILENVLPLLYPNTVLDARKRGDICNV